MDKKTNDFPKTGFCETKDLSLIDFVIKNSNATEENKHKFKDFAKYDNVGIAWNVNGPKNLRFWFIKHGSSLPRMSEKELKRLLKNSTSVNSCYNYSHAEMISEHCLETEKVIEKIDTNSQGLETLDYIEFTSYPTVIEKYSQTINTKIKQPLTFKFTNINTIPLCQNSKKISKVS